MYLSKIELNIGHPSVRQALRNCNDMHRNLMAAFVFEDGRLQARAEQHMLYRKIITDTSAMVLMMSREKPDVDILCSKGYNITDAHIKDMGAVVNSLTVGRNLRFDLLTYPCKKVSGDFKNSKRVYLRTEQERMQWLNRKAEQNGFAVLTAQESGQTLNVLGTKASEHIAYCAVRYTGVLQVTDAALFQRAYIEGIGSGKSYGLGMLLLSKV